MSSGAFSRVGLRKGFLGPGKLFMGIILKAPKFVAKERSQFANVLKKRVNQYFLDNTISPKANGEMIFKTCVMLCIYFLPFAVILTVKMSAWLALLLVGIMGFGISGIGMSVMHDGGHGAYSAKSWINNIVGGTLYLLGGATLNWRIKHNMLHHTYTNIEGHDEDIRSRTVIRMSPNAPWNKVHQYQYIYAFFLYSFLTISILLRDFSLLGDFNKRGLVKQLKAKPGIEYFKLILSKIIYLGFIIGLPLWLTDFAWYQVLAGFFVLHMTCGIIMSLVFQLAHVVENAEFPIPNEEGNIENEWFIHQMETTVDFARNNSLINWFCGGLNFQIEHHLFPNICHVHYPKIAPIVEMTAKEFGVPYHQMNSFTEAVGAHINMLKKLGRNQGNLNELKAA